MTKLEKGTIIAPNSLYFLLTNLPCRLADAFFFFSFSLSSFPLYVCDCSSHVSYQFEPLLIYI